MEIFSSVLNSPLKVVNRVADDLLVERISRRSDGQAEIVSRYRFSRVQSGGMIGPEVRTVISSAYVISLMSSGGLGMLFI